MKYFIFEVEIKLGFPEYRIVKAKNLKQAETIMYKLYCGINYFSCGKTTHILGD